MAAQEITPEQWTALREAAVNLGDAITEFALSFTRAMEEIDWKGIRHSLEAAVDQLDNERTRLDDEAEARDA